VTLVSLPRASSDGLTGHALQVIASQVTTHSVAIPSVLFARAGGFPLLAR
jgi:hypothetical protein